MGRWAVERQAAELALVVVPSLTFVAQTCGRDGRLRVGRADGLVMCSDPTSAAGLAERDTVDGGEVDTRGVPTRSLSDK